MEDNLLDNEANRQKAALLREAVTRLLQEAAVRGFYGEIAVWVVVQDGVIQEVREERRRKLR